LATGKNTITYEKLSGNGTKIGQTTKFVYVYKNNFMKYLWLLAILIFTSAAVQAQAKKTSKPGAKKTAAKGKTNKRLKTSSGGVVLDELDCIENGPCSFRIRKGDTLVYDVSGAGQQYALMIVPNKFDNATIADFNWITISGADKKNGHIVINTAALTSSKKYVTSLLPGEIKLSDASMFWLCNSSFKEIAYDPKQTSVTFDNNGPEVFSSPEEDAVSTPINYKGNPIELDGFLIENKPEGSAGRKEIWVLNTTSNLLMFKIDNGTTTMLLKEVKEKKKAAAPVKKKK
jgi:hypothetical protein